MGLDLVQRFHIEIGEEDAVMLQEQLEGCQRAPPESRALGKDPSANVWSQDGHTKCWSNRAVLILVLGNSRRTSTAKTGF